MMRHTDLPLPWASSIKLYVQRPQHAEWWTHRLSHMLQSQKHYMVSKWHTLLYRHDRFIKSSNKVTIEHMQKHQFLTKPISSHIHDSLVIFLNVSPGWWFQLLWIIWSTSIYSWSNWLRRTKWPTMMRHTDLPLPRASAGGIPRSLKLYVQRPQHAEWWTHHLWHTFVPQKHYMVSKWHTLLYSHDWFIKSRK